MMCWDYDDPEDYDDPTDYDPCDHDQYDVDILTGRAHCHRCGEAWWLTSDQLKEELKIQAEMYESHAAEMEAASGKK
jgi:hypothetical protein